MDTAPKPRAVPIGREGVGAAQTGGEIKSKRSCQAPLRVKAEALRALGIAFGYAFERLRRQDDNFAPFEADPFVLLPNA